MHVAAKQSAINLATLLIARGADVDSRDLDLCTPLHIAAQYAENAMVELLLANNADTRVNTIFYGSSPLHVALTGDFVEKRLAFLIKAQADVEARDCYGRTALLIAVENDLPAAALALLEHRASTEVIDKNEETRLLVAARNGRQWAIELLLEKGANLEARNREGKTALCNAVEKNQELMVRVLLGHGAAINSGVGYPLSHIAVDNANVSMVDMLLRAGADIDAKDYDNKTALHRAVLGDQEPHEHIMKLLLTHSAPLDAVTGSGNAVFHYAVMCQRRNMILILLQYVLPDELSTTCKMRNVRGETPLDLARDFAKYASESSDERSILFLLENALKLSHT